MSRVVILGLLFGAVFLPHAGAAASAAERGFTRTFPVAPGCTLIVDTYHGEIAIEESDAAEVRVELNVDFDVKTDAEAAKLWDGLKYRFEAANNTVKIAVRNETATGPRFSWEDERRMNLYYRIFVPRECNLQLKTGRGKISVGRVTGRMSARVETGTIFFRQVDGSIDAATEAGDIVVSRCSGAVKARVRQGSIQVGTIGGTTDLRTSNGSVEVLQARGALTVEAEVGDVSVNFPRDYAAAASLTALGGNVNLRVDPAANCDIDAAATWGTVKNSLRLTGTNDDRSLRRVTGRLNRGGLRIKARADGGSVTLAPGETLFDESR